METTNSSRKKLAEYILNEANDMVIEQIEQLIQEKKDNIVGFTADGNSLSRTDYIEHIETISEKIKNGEKTYSAEEVREYVINKKHR